MENKLKQYKVKISTPKYLYFKPVVAFFAVLLMFLTGLVGLAQGATAGSTLYPVKLLADKVAAKVSGKPEINTEKRAQDVIEVSRSNPAQLPEASKQYKKALNETEKAVEQGRVNKNQVNRSLDKQEQWLKQAIKDNPKSKEELKKILQNAHSVKEKINSKNKQKPQDRNN